MKDSDQGVAKVRYSLPKPTFSIPDKLAFAFMIAGLLSIATSMFFAPNTDNQTIDNTAGCDLLAPLLGTVHKLGISGCIGFIIFVLALVYYDWRYNKFAISNYLPTREPKMYPYALPFVGHTIALARDPQGVVTRARQYFGDTRDPFSLFAFGVEFVFITNPKHVSQVYKNTNTLTHDVFLEDLLGAFRVTKSARELIFFTPQSDGSGFQLITPNPAHRSLARLTVDLFREQLQPGDMLNQLTRITVDYIKGSVDFASLNPSLVLSTSNNTKDLALLQWCETVMLTAANLSFFGPALHEVAPDILKDFLAFDALSWKAMYKLPSFLAGDMLTAKAKLEQGIERFFRLDKEQRKGSNWFIDTQEAEMTHLGLSIEDMAKCITMIFWVINTNAYKLLFWMITYVLQDESLLFNVTRELRTLLECNSIDIENFSAKLMPYTNALWFETLRVTNSSSSARFATQDTLIGGHIIRAGKRVLVPYRQIHYDEAKYAHPEQLDVQRYLKRDAITGKIVVNEDLSNYNGSYRPFGGGRWLCPGRHLAKIEVIMGMALFLCSFNAEISPLQEPSKMPEMDEKMPGIGIIAPVIGTNLRVRVSERKSWASFDEKLAASADNFAKPTRSSSGV